jgi:hypothetical protein
VTKRHRGIRHRFCSKRNGRPPARKVFFLLRVEGEVPFCPNVLRFAYVTRSVRLHDVLDAPQKGAGIRSRKEVLMPEKETLDRAHEDAREGKSPSTQAGEFVREEMHHIREGKHGARSTKQAIAIGLSKARHPNRPKSRRAMTNGGQSHAGSRPRADRELHRALSSARGTRRPARNLWQLRHVGLRGREGSRQGIAPR